MNTTRHLYLLSITLLALTAQSLHAQVPAGQDLAAPTDTLPQREEQLGQAQVVARGKAVRHDSGPVGGFTITRTELFRAACCNLGESFTTNPSVDVNYSDAATGARQIRLLGLSGSYVQMLSENVPDLRGLAAPYALGYVPGPWMQSIQVSKGSASVKNGYEGITGQINVEYKKPQAEPQGEVNLYGDSKGRIEANFDGNLKLGTRGLSASILTHYEDNLTSHDDNHDGFLDKPKVRQVNMMNRWAYVRPRYIMQAEASVISERRRGGQTIHSHEDASQAISTNVMGGTEISAESTFPMPLYRIEMQTTRVAGWMKNAFILAPSHGTNLALILSGTYHTTDASYGLRLNNADQRTGYASLLFETDFTPQHKLSTGLSANVDDYLHHYQLEQRTATPVERLDLSERVAGGYAQYTFSTPDERFTLMAGLRADHSSLHGLFLTPRLHLKYSPTHAVSMRLSAGRGYRTVFPLAEYSYLLASSRHIEMPRPQQEAAWNVGTSFNFKLPLGGHILDLTADYYYTLFTCQLVPDYDASTEAISLHGLEDHHSYSHTAQVEATYSPVRGLTFTAAYRYNFVRQYTGGRLQEKPLQSRYKGLLTLSYKTPLELWQFDLTAQLNGGGRLPANGIAGESLSFPAYGSLNAQVTRWFRHMSIYIGGENLTNYRQEVPIIEAAHPWSSRFDATQVWGPVHGAMAYAGLKVNF